MKIQTIHFLLPIALIFSLLTPPTIAHAATRTVGDCTAPSGNAARLVDQITAASSGDTINFSCSATITLAATITIAKNLTIDGTGQTVTISGGIAVRVLIVNTGVSLTLNNLTIANGKIPSGSHGGGIINLGALTITNSTFSGNSTTSGYGGGISNNGTLTVTNSTFSGNSAPLAGGGGIMNSGTLTITNSTFSGNSTTSGGNGGGIYNNSGTATITNSTFSSNSTTSGGYGNGGGIYINAGAVTITSSTFSSNSMIFGGGIYNLGTLTLTNNTFSGNSATGGGDIYNAAGTTTITNNTFSGNSANPIYNAAGTVTLRNTIVANGTSGGNCIGTITNGGNNIDSVATCGWTTTNGSMSNTNPLLGTLASNGGPTQTFALLTGSPAAEGVTFNAPNSAPSTDQRGVARPQGVRYDIGAYETTRQSGPNFVVDALADPGDGVCEYAPAGDCTLREAINAANALAGANTITFGVGGTITLGSTLPTITDAAGLTIDGTGQTVTISGNNAVRVGRVNAGASLTLDHLTIANGYSNSSLGGGFLNGGTLTITNSTFSGNHGGWGGGGIDNEGGALTITNSTFTGNITDFGGGGVFASGGTLVITNSTFSGNSAGTLGGGIYNFSGSTLTMTNSTFSGNSGGWDAAGIYNNAGTVTLRNTIVANSTSGGNCSGTITNGGNNIDSGITCGWVSALGSMRNTNPLLGALANNGGPTQTFALLTGSPAIDGVTSTPPNGAPSTDQRGVARPQGVRYDIGSYEYGVSLYATYLPLIRR